MWFRYAQRQSIDEQVFSSINPGDILSGDIVRGNMPLSSVHTQMLQAISQAGGKSLIVGGAVRDAVLDLLVADIDTEVYGLSYNDLSDILHGALGRKWRIDLVGAAFAVIKVINRSDPGEQYDFSLPRRENKAGKSHIDFDTQADPNMHPAVACARRDFTFNSMAHDPLENVLYDFFGGLEDLKNKIIRATSTVFQGIPTNEFGEIDISQSPFAEDALRVLRGMQFAARFGLAADETTANLCQAMIGEYQYLSRERVEAEWMKLAGKGVQPSVGLNFLRDVGWDMLFPGLFDEQFNERCEIADRLVHLTKDLSGRARAIIGLAVMTNDPATLNSMGVNKKSAETMMTLHSALHESTQTVEEMTPSAVRKLVSLLGQIEPEMLLPMISARGHETDALGRAMEEEGALARRPLLNGTQIMDLIAERFPENPIQPGPALGQIIQNLLGAQIGGQVNSEQDAIQWVFDQYML